MSCSSSTPEWIYDVFLSFRGEDTRRTFVAYLYDALSRAGINTYIDYRLQKGTELGPQLLQAIDGSRISIVVFSQNFHTSTWCLKELEHIMECRRGFRQVVLPVFYHVDPSVLRQKGGDFGKVLEETARRGSSGVERRNSVLSTWQIILTKAANISGWHTKNYRDDVQLIYKIVQDVKRNLNNKLVTITEFPVGLDTRVQKLIHFMEKQSSKVCLIGIWGMGGLGKTTTATAIYNQFHGEFVVPSFIENIREACEEGNRGSIHLKQQQLLDIMKATQKRLMGNRALVVLDDVSTLNQVEALCKKRKCFGTGSVLVVTTRDLRILELLKADRIYIIKEMDENKSLELFSWHAFGERSPKGDFSELSSKIVAYCRGLPLALEAIGSDLRERTKEDWITELLQLERNPNYRVQENLKISYAGLQRDAEKEIFLDICCFFIGKDKTYVTEILDGCKLYAGSGINVLIERSLLKVEKNNKLQMHDLLRDMGREIVRERSMKKLGKCCRLWFHEDAHKVLAEKTGKETVEGLVLKSQSASKISFNAESFKKMRNLRLLQLDRVRLVGDYGQLSRELRWLHWRGFTRNYIPDDFYQGNLVVFELKHSNIKQVWNETKMMKKLKILNLSHSKYLEKTPDFSKLPNLQKFIMKACPNLFELHPSVGDLKNIQLINLKDCTSLINLSQKIYQLKSLKTLILSGCSKIDKLEEEIVQMESLTTLVAKDTTIKKVPYSIIRLKSIGYISLCGYEGLSHDIFPSLIWSWMSPTRPLLPRIFPFGNMALSLASNNVQNNNLGFPSQIIRNLSQLQTVRVQYRSKDELTRDLHRILDDNQYDVNFAESETSNPSQISNCSLRSLLIGMGSCHKFINTLGKSISQALTTNNPSNFFIPGGNCPSWLAYTRKGPSALIQIPKDIDCHVKGIILGITYSSTSENIRADECLISVLIVNYTKCTIQIYKRDTLMMSFNVEDWKNVTSNLGLGDDVEIFVVFGHALIVMETTIYLIYVQSTTREFGQSIIMEVEPSTNMEMKPSAEVNVQPLAEVSMQPSPNVKVEASTNVKTDPSQKVKVQSSPIMEMEPLAEVSMQPSPEVNMKPSPNVKVEPSTNVKIDPSQEVKVRSSPIMEMEPLVEMNVQPSPAVNVQPSPAVNVQPSPNGKVEASTNVKTDPSEEVKVQSSPIMEMEPLAEVNVQPSPEVNMQPSPNVKAEASTNVNSDPSQEVMLQSSPIMKMEPPPKSNRSIFTRFAKRRSACLCSNQHKR